MGSEAERSPSLDAERREDARDDDAGFSSSVQAGTLTAGTFDDTRNPEAFARFMASMARQQSTQGVAAAYGGGMTQIKVVDAAGQPVAGASVRVRGVSTDKRLVSGTDGRVILFSGVDGSPAGDGWQVRVEQGGRASRWHRVDDGAKQALRSVDTTPAIDKLDVALVIDATGSMGDELEYLKVELRSIVDAVDRALPGVDQRWALVVYRDESDAFVTRRHDFTHNLAQFERQLGRQQAMGGGDYPEAMDAAMADAAELSWRRDPSTAKLVFLVADAPPHTNDMQATMRSTEDLRAQGVAVYPVAASGVASEAEVVMRASAAATGGQYVFLTDDSGVGLAHAEPHIPCYEVEHLRVAMVRMIHSELVGDDVEPNPNQVIRRVGASQRGVCQTAGIAQQRLQ